MAVLVFILFIWLIFLHSKMSDMQTLLNVLELKIERLCSKSYYYDDDKSQDIGEKSTSKPMAVPQPVINDVNYENNSKEESVEEDYIEEEYIEEEYIEEKTSQSKKYSTAIYSQSKKDNTFENLFMGNVFNVMGAIAIIIACGFFVKLISPLIIFTPILKTLIGGVVGLAMVLFGIHTKKETLKRYSEILIGTGFSVLFITIYCTTILFKTFPLPVCVILGFILLSAAYYVADKQKTVSMISIALIGGYLNVFLVASEVSAITMFAYLIFLNLLSILFAYRNPDKFSINIINIFVTLFVIICPGLLPHKIQTLICPVILWSLYLAYDAISRFKNPKIYDTKTYLTWSNLAALVIFSLVVCNGSHINIGCILVVASIVYNIVSSLFIYKQSDDFKPYIYNMLASILLAVYFLVDDVTRIIVWSIIAMIISVFVSTLKRDYLATWSLIFIGVATTALFFVNGVCYTDDISKYVPVFNSRLLAFAFPLLACILSSILYGKSTNKENLNISHILKLLYISLIYLFVVFEANDFITSKMEKIETGMHFVKCMIFSIVGFKYALQVRKFGMMIKNVFIEMTGLLACIIALVVLMFAGYNYEPIGQFIPILNIRFIAFISGILACAFYAKWTKTSFWGYLATTLGFVLMLAESNDYIDKYSLPDSYLVSVVLLLYSGIMMTIGIFKNNKVLKNSGIVVSLFTVVKIIFYDLANVEMTYKLIIFMILGFMFMLISYFYNKNKS